jgi:lipopolysaccharide biosynthesis protein
MFNRLGFVWRKLPLSIAGKQKLKTLLFTCVPGLFRHTRAFDCWTSLQASCLLNQRHRDNMARLLDQRRDPDCCYVPASSAPAPDKPRARLICFYLPQFHPIAENDAWWGRGFTEWSNVRPAQAQFASHYQPHVPDQLGYYNLLDPEVQRQQVALARQYGIGGFCFYFYWFGGKRLLEAPILNYLQERSLDLPFCLCWANENWSRRWDGLESEILIAQQHSAEDDLAFIRHIAPYLRDSRYLRINGKPLLLVYRPELLPCARETALRWRRECRELGVGEIHLAYTQSFESVDPEVYGFDAAVEFPPNNSASPVINDSVAAASPEFKGTVYDWRIFIERSENYQAAGYPLYRAVCPSWDNTARRGKRASIFVHNTPELYQRWLKNAITDTCARQPDPEQRLVFINAWNEWAEGAHLEPDARYGYAWLQASRNALDLACYPRARDMKQSICVVIHAFYPELLAEMFEYLKDWTIPYRLVISSVPEQEHAIESVLARFGLQATLVIGDNRGRDILPFLKVFAELVGQEWLILKLHTKRSPHRQDGDIWRRDLLEKLISPANARAILSEFQDNVYIGMVGPEGHLLSLDTYWGSNAASVMRLMDGMGAGNIDVKSSLFVAGSMFYVRPEAISALLTLGLKDQDFEAEAGQLDGTLAHALERCLSLAVNAAGYAISSTRQPGITASQGKRRYRFAPASV